MKGSKVDVIMSAYNAESFLRAAIDSVLNQVFTDFSLYVVNDGSKDGTLPILDEYARQDCRVHVLDNGGNRGLIYSLNYAIEQSSSPFIARMDADDIMHYRRLADQVGFLDTHPDYVLCGTAILKFRNSPWRRIFKRRRRALDNDDFNVQLMRNPPLAHPASMFRRSALPALPYSPSALHAEDYALWSELTCVGKAAVLPAIRLYYREHATQVSNIYAESQRETANSIRLRLLERKGFQLNDEQKRIYLALMGGKAACQSADDIVSLCELLVSQCAQGDLLNTVSWQHLLSEQAHKLGVIWRQSDSL